MVCAIVPLCVTFESERYGGVENSMRETLSRSVEELDDEEGYVEPRLAPAHAPEFAANGEAVAQKR